MMTTIRMGAAVVVAVTTMMFASGCTITLPEGGRSLSVGPAANPNNRESPPPAPMQQTGNRDDNRTAAR